MKATEDHPVKGLWSNLKHGKEVGGFTWPEIADQMTFYVTGGERKKLTRALERIVNDRQLTSHYVSALARAWGIPDVVLLHGHFDTCATREALKEQTGFDADAIVARWHQNRELHKRYHSTRKAFITWVEELKKDHDMLTIVSDAMKKADAKKADTKKADPEDEATG
jgi:hypothetical protein